MTTEAGYEGWKNRATWNIALWVNNDEPLYRSAVEYVRARKAKGKRPSWSNFVAAVGLAGERTPDRFAFDGAKLDRKALTEMLAEIDS